MRWGPVDPSLVLVEKLPSEAVCPAPSSCSREFLSFDHPSMKPAVCIWNWGARGSVPAGGHLSYFSNEGLLEGDGNFTFFCRRCLGENDVPGVAARQGQGGSSQELPGGGERHLPSPPLSCVWTVPSVTLVCCCFSTEGHVSRKPLSTRQTRTVGHPPRLTYFLNSFREGQCDSSVCLWAPLSPPSLASFTVESRV